MSKIKNNDQHTLDIRGDAGLLTGPALVGGTKLVYEAGKDLYSLFKPEKKIFIQLTKSCYIDRHHVITARIASVHVHGIHIESVTLKNGQSKDIDMYEIQQRKIGHSISYDSDERLVSYPYQLSPNESFDVIIKIIEQTDSKIKKEKGASLICTFSCIDKLGDPEKISVSIRLLWGNNT